MGRETRVINTIRAQRFAHGEMTQAELASRVGVNRQTVIAIEQSNHSGSGRGLATSMLRARVADFGRGTDRTSR